MVYYSWGKHFHSVLTYFWITLNHVICFDIWAFISTTTIFNSFIQRWSYGYKSLVLSLVILPRPQNIIDRTVFEQKAL